MAGALIVRCDYARRWPGRWVLTRAIEPLLYVEPSPPSKLMEAMRLVMDAALQRPMRTEPLVVDDVQWPGLWTSLRRHRVGPLLASPLDDGRLLLPAEAAEEVRGETQSMARGFLQLSAAAQSAKAVLDAAGVEALVLKGLATGNLDYPTGWVRHTGDVDLLCRRSDFGNAIAALRTAGSTDRKSGTPVDLLVEETLVTPAGVELDVHHRLFRFGPSIEESLFDRAVALPDGIGRALGREARLIHAAGHLLFSPPGTRRLSSLVDVALLSCSPDLDEDVLERLANEIGIRDVVEFARWIADALGKDDAPRMPDRALSLINSAHIRTERSVPLETLALLRDQGNLRRQARYLAYQARRLLRN